MTLLAVTVLGHDRPGIIAETTGVLAELGANLEDSSMSILRGHFAMVVLATAEVTLSEAEQALDSLTADGSLQVTVREIPYEEPAAPRGTMYLLSVHGGDRPGIVATLTGIVTQAGGNITDLSTRLTSGLYVLLAEVDLASEVDPEQLSRDLVTVGADLGVEVSFRVLDLDVL